MAAASTSARGVEASRTASAETRPIGPGAALVFALGSAVAFAVSDAIGPLRDDLDSAFLLAGLVGWVLLGWTALVAAAALVALIGRLVARRPVSRLEIGLLAAAIAVLILESVLHPLWGSGSSSGS